MRLNDSLVDKDDKSNDLDYSDNNSSRNQSFYYSLICQSYGQNNIEKSIIILSALIIYSSVLINKYYYVLSSIIFIPLIISTLLNVASLGIFGYFLKSLQSASVFNYIPSNIEKINNGIILLNSLNEFVIIVLIFFSFNIDWMCYILFFIRFLIEIYFISIKAFMICPYTRILQDSIDDIIRYIKKYFNNDNNNKKYDYKLLDEYESSYYA